MARVSSTPDLQRSFDLPVTCEVERGPVAGRMRRWAVPWRRPGGHITDERGPLRRPAAGWVGGRQIEHRLGLRDAVADDSDAHLLQALSGG